MNASNFNTPLVPPRLVRYFGNPSKGADGEIVPIQVVKAGKSFTVRPNPAYGGELIIEVGFMGAFEAMMSSPEVYKVADDLEASRSGKKLVTEILANPDLYRAAFRELGFVHRDDLHNAKPEQAVQEVPRRGPGRPRKAE